jgi:hypothetical protein
MCNPGDIVFIGSYATLYTELIDIYSDFHILPTFNGWTAIIDENDPTDSSTVRAFATCFDNSP